MSVWNSEDFKQIVRHYLGTERFDILDFSFKKAADASLGLIAISTCLFIKISVINEVRNLRFFVKLLPENPLHLENVEKAGCFLKETEFFNRIQPKLSKFQRPYSLPKCYFADEKKGVVLEDLMVLGYKNIQSKNIFDLAHCETTLEALAEIHASSLLYENENNVTLYSQFTDIMFISWFSEFPDHPGYKHLHTGARAIGKVIDVYFKGVSPQTKEKILTLIRSVPKGMRPSAKFRNVLSHCDLWSNNVMFKYKDNAPVEACILDFQLFAYTPPMLDILILIYSNTDKIFREEYLDHLLKFYYERLSSSIKRNNQNPSELLAFEYFMDSFQEAHPTALAIAVLFIHFTSLPDDYLLAVITDEKCLRNFMENDRSEFILNAIEKNNVYKDRLLTAIQDVINYFETS